jgi:dCMP deaminase
MMAERSVTKSVVFMEVARQIAVLGTCDRAQVGAVIIRDGRCITWGYNGAPPGLPHCNENNHGWGIMVGLLEQADRIPAQGCRNATHAEANALAFAARHGISTDGGTLYVTVSPCENCARLLIAAGIVGVHADEEYRDQSGINVLLAANIPIFVAR